jgi:hypothetical protein
MTLQNSKLHHPIDIYLYFVNLIYLFLEQSNQIQSHHLD